MLLFSKVIGVFGWGVISALAMAFGTSLTISMLALLVHYSRRLAVRLSRSRAPAARSAVAGALALAGGLILLAAGLLLYVSAQPEFGGGIRPFSANGHKSAAAARAIRFWRLTLQRFAQLHAWWPAWLSLRAGCLQPRCRS